MRNQLNKVLIVTFVILFFTLSKSYSIEDVTEFTDAINEAREEFSNVSKASTEQSKIIDEALVGEEENIAKFQGGSDRVLGYFVGKCLKSTKGKGNPKLINKILLEKLKK